DQSVGQEEGDLLLGGECDVCLYQFSSRLFLVAVQVKPRCKVEGVGHGEGMPELMRQRERLADRRQGLVGIAEKPEVMGREAPAHDARVLQVERGQSAIALGVPEGDPLRAVLTGTDEVSQEVTMSPKRTMGGGQERRVFPVVREPQQ